MKSNDLAESLRDAFACFVPMLTFIEAKLVGRLFLSEMILLCMLPFLLIVRGRLLLLPSPKRLLLFGLAWLLSQMATDVIMGTPFVDWSRGWAKIIFFLLNFSAIYLYLNGKEKRISLFAAGLAFSQILAFLFNRSDYAELYPWKFGYGTAITVLVLLASQVWVSERRSILSFPIMLGLGVLNFYMEFRSLGAICLLVGAYQWKEQGVRYRLKGRQAVNATMFLILSGVAIYSVAEAYSYVAEAGLLGEDAYDKQVQQNSGDFGILAGGRSEIFASSQAVIDSPIIGHGSWAKDSKYVDTMVDRMLQKGYTPDEENDSDLIPSHSYIMGAWVEAGLVGALFWIWALLLTLRALIATHGMRTPLLSLITYLALNLLWGIPFSPFGADSRLQVAYQLSVMIYVLAWRGSLAAKNMPT